MLKIILPLAAIMVLLSCTTTEYREEKTQCTADWMEKIPPLFVQELYNETYTREVPTGQTECVTSGVGLSAYTSCTAVMRTEYYTLPAVRTVDRNQGQRDRQIAACTQRTCIQKYGNADCKA